MWASSMASYILKRLLFMVPILVGITMICFTVMHLRLDLPRTSRPR
jgi:peptide/nickel transport system permease protein